MKVSAFKNTALFFVFLLGALFAPLNATTPFAKKEYSKKIEKSFPISPDGKVNLNNRYGQITVKTWDQNKVEVEVVIKVNSRSEESAEETFERIDIQMTNTDEYVSVETHIESNKQSGWTNWFGSYSSDDYSIHYLVHMPSSNNLTLANKYGNSAVESIKGNAEFIIKYGNIDAGDVGGDLTFDLGYGNATLGNTGDANVVIKYSNFKMDNTKDLRIESKYSKVKIESTDNIRSISKYDSYKLGKVKSFRNEGKYDHFDIEHIEEIEINTKYTDVSIEYLQQSADVEMTHGGFRVKKLEDGFDKLNLEGRYTNFKIGCSGHFQLDAAVSYGNIHYPDGMEIMIDKEKSNDHEVEGYYGNRNSGMIKARMDYGDLKIY